MKLVKYKIERLIEPIGNTTHKLVYESISKNRQSGGFGCGVRHKGTYKECLERKREIEYELSKSKKSSFMVSTKPQQNR